MTLRTLDYGNYGIFLIMGNAGFISSTVGPPEPLRTLPKAMETPIAPLGLWGF